MADETVDINIRDNSDKAAAGFLNLREAIRFTREQLEILEAQGKRNTTEFEALRAQLDEYSDAQERAGFSSGQLDDKLAALPGGLGRAGQAFKDINDSINVFGKSTTIALGVVGLIVGIFAALRKSLDSTAEGQATLNRLTESFNKVLGPVLALLESVAVPLFNTLADILVVVANGLGKFVEFLGIAQSKIAEASLSEEAKKQLQDFQNEVKKLEDEFNLERLTSADAQARKKLQLERDAQLESIRQSEFSEEQKSTLLLKTQELYNQKSITLERELTQKRKEELEKRTKEAFDIYSQEQSARFALGQSELEFELEQLQESAKLQDDFGASTVARQKELLEQIRDTRIDILDELTNAAVAATESEELQNILYAQFEQNKIEITQETNKKIAELDQNLANERLQIQIDQTNDQINNLNKLNDAIANDYKEDIQRLQLQQQLLDELYIAQINAVGLTEEQKYQIRRDYADKTDELTDQQIAKQAELNAATIQAAQETGFALANLIGQVASYYDQDANNSEKAFEQRRKFLRAQTIVQGAAGLIQILGQPSTLPSPADFIVKGINAAALTAATLVALRQINTAQFESPEAAGSPITGGAGTIGATAPEAFSPLVNLFTATQAGTSAGIVSAAILENNSAQRPLRAYVTIDDVNSAQELNRRIGALARL